MDIKLIKEIRTQTGASLGDCKTSDILFLEIIELFVEHI